MIEMTDEQREASELVATLRSQLRAAEGRVKSLSKAIGLRMLKAKGSSPMAVACLMATMGADLRSAISDEALLREVLRGAEAVNNDLWAPPHD
ncbi:hypothetical protein CcrC1_gp068c [Caulobacter phage C1]|nr:hypothetical protein CcrC1_gp068c [Caulobacter phage C1]UTU08295.1 hypothetical protein CcrC2_gp067c [Caulobacter phage C2]UTU08818.1 hypothetical protein CcrJ4_gp067c [Caulobacter phage J4]UTU09370.1 hypothetical protein CcrBL47_gp084c [Caulobacter phage BL47]UTU09930.1 hypothetical protein CcrRB23_gp068c [Caulobacter phage RB23]WGN96955.1 hypothetical protein [Bertelyvirus sp.]